MSAVARALSLSLQFDERAGSNDGVIGHVANCRHAETMRRATLDGAVSGGVRL